MNHFTRSCAAFSREKGEEVYEAVSHVVKMLFYVSMLFFTASAATGLSMSDHPIGIILVPLPALIWVSTRKSHPSIGLFLSLGTTATGILLGAPGPIMLVGTGLILLAWNIALVEASSPTSDPSPVRSNYLAGRIIHMLVALVVIATAILLGRSLTVRMTLYVVSSIVILTAFAYARLIKCLQRRY